MIEKICNEIGITPEQIIIEKLQQENEQLKEELEEYKNPNKYFKYANKNVTDENKQLKDNWDKLKKIIKKKFVAQGGFTSYEWNDLLNELLDKMQELERESDE